MPRPSAAEGSTSRDTSCDLPPRLRARRSAAAARSIATAVLSVAILTLTGCGDGSAPPSDASITRSTSLVVGVGVLGNRDKPEQACGELAPLDPGMVADGQHAVPTAGGASVSVPNDPQRVVVIGNAPLDTLCALGLQDRVVAMTPSGNPELAPRYLGSWVAVLPKAGGDGVADIDAIQALRPDVILVGPPSFSDERPGLGNGQLGALESIAPTVAAPSSEGWQQSASALADSVGRSAAMAAALESYRSDTAAASQEIGAAQTEVSMLRFTADGAEILGESSFPGQVFTELGLRRPLSQRFGSPVAQSVDESNLRQAEGDVLYIAFQGKNTGRSDRGGDTASIRHGTEVMDSDAWQALGVTGGKAKVVDDGVWIEGGGLIAARLMVDGIQETL